MGKYIKRGIEKKILSTLQSGFVVGLIGPRQVGKTTLLNRISTTFQQEGIAPKRIFFFNFDDVILRTKVASDFYFIPNFIEQRLNENLDRLSSPIYILIDEVQKVPQIFDWVKIIHDNFSPKVKIILSGSSSLDIQKNTAESLAGRIVYTYLYPLSIKEILEYRLNLSLINGLFKNLFSFKLTLADIVNVQKQILTNQFDQQRQLNLILEKILLDGCLPIIWTGEKEKELIFKSLIEIYLEKDIRGLKEIGSLEDFNRLVSLVAFEIGRLINISNISSDLGIAINTVKKYLSTLQSSFVLNKLPPFFLRSRKRFIKSAKLYFYDVGVANFLAKRYILEHIKGEVSGFLFENILLKSLEAENKNSKQPLGIYFWRDYQNHEVDLVLEKGGKLIPVEITLANQLTKEKERNLEKFFSSYSDSPFGLIVYQGQVKEIKIAEKQIFLVPWWLWW